MHESSSDVLKQQLQTIVECSQPFCQCHLECHVLAYTTLPASLANARVNERVTGCCKCSRRAQAAKDWGWREFVTLTSLFDIDAGFLVNDAVVFSAEVRCHAMICQQGSSCTT